MGQNHTINSLRLSLVIPATTVLMIGLNGTDVKQQQGQFRFGFCNRQGI
jgi:hypothetical protein